MVDTLYKYRIWCETDQKYEYSWNEAAPSGCPANNGHTVDLDSVAVVDQIDSSVIKTKVVEEVVETGGHFQATSIIIPTNSGTQGEWEEVDISWPFPVSLLSAEFIITEDHLGDEIECVAVPDKIVGVVTENLTTSGTSFQVSPTVVDNSVVGLYVSVTDGVNVDNLGRITDIDSENFTVTVESAPSNTYSAASPTYFRISAKFVENFDLVVPGRHTIGDTKIGASNLPANEKLRFRYKNNDGQEKKFAVVLEYLY